MTYMETVLLHLAFHILLYLHGVGPLLQQATDEGADLL